MNSMVKRKVKNGFLKATNNEKTYFGWLMTLS